MIHSNNKMCDILFDEPRLLLVLERFGMMLGYRDQTVEEVCQTYQLNSRLFLIIANLFSHRERSPIQPQTFDVHDIIPILRFLKNSHVYFLEEKIPKLKQLINNKINSVPQENCTRLIQKFLDDYSREVLEHMEYENRTVFPYIDALLVKKQTTYSIKQFKEHHTDIEVKLEDLKNLLIQHMPADYDFQLRRKMLLELFDLENDIAIHDYIENYLLIPIVEVLEKERQ